jgi:tetratricopeptide (TPR) repeat protein
MAEASARLAEQALAAGDLHRAAHLLAQAARDEGNNSATWMNAAAVYRRVGAPEAALDAVHHALALAPLDFTALLMRASLLNNGTPNGSPTGNKAWRTPWPRRKSRRMTSSSGASRGSAAMS